MAHETLKPLHPPPKQPYWRRQLYAYPLQLAGTWRESVRFKFGVKIFR